MTIEMMLILAAAGFALAFVLIGLYVVVPKRLKQDKFMRRWQDLQKQLRDPSQWAEALLRADGLLDEALRKRKFKGGSMGERMVSAQRFFSNNDDIWFAHNLAKKLKVTEDMKLKENNVKDALVAFRQALRDLGALDNGQPRDAQ